MNLETHGSSHTSKQHEAATQALGGPICSTEHKSCNGRKPKAKELKSKGLVQSGKAQMYSLSRNQQACVDF